MPAAPHILQRLRSRIAAIERGGTGTLHVDDVLPLGLSEIDEHLPRGGFAAGAVHAAIMDIERYGRSAARDEGLYAPLKRYDVW